MRRPGISSGKILAERLEAGDGEGGSSMRVAEAVPTGGCRSGEEVKPDLC